MNIDFKNLGLNSEVLKSIETLGFVKPSKIQEQVIPLILEGKDVIGQAQTGTGKTLAYASSVLSMMDINTNVVKAIILTPTRELALQVCEEFKTLNNSKKLNILAVYGGSSIETQIKALKKGVDIVVGTAGRVQDLIKRKKLNIENLEFFVLDEADEMLNMGFLEDIENIFKHTNENKQVLMFSATMPKEIKKLATKYMKDAQSITVKATSKTSENVEQHYYVVNDKARAEVLCRLLDIKSNTRTIVFCQTKKECDELLSELSSRGYKAETMHGDITQSMRIKTLDRFKKGSFKVLIATDVAARGIHIDNIEYVINYRLPQEFEAYIHRIGRTGRAGHKGEAVSLVSRRGVKEIARLSKYVNSEITQKDLPSAKEIMKHKYQTLLDEALNLPKELTNEALEYVRDLNKQDIINLAAALLVCNVKKELGSDLNKNIELKEEKSKTIKAGTTRVFVNVGKKDNAKKGSLLDFIKEKTKIDKDNFNNIEVLKTFTFIDVNSKVVKEFMKKINKTRFNGRTVRIEIANKQR